MSQRDYFKLLSKRKLLDNRAHTKFLAAKKYEKIVTFDEVCESRPPLNADMSGPTPTHYKVSYNSCSSPSYSFGRKCNDIVMSTDGTKVAPFHMQPQYNADFPKPSPAAYEPPKAVGNGQYCYGSAPAFSIGPNNTLGLSKKQRNNTPKKGQRIRGFTRQPNNAAQATQCTPRGTLYRRVHPQLVTSTTKLAHKPGPSACTYNVRQSERNTMQRAPAFSMGTRNEKSGFLGNAQRAARETPACNSYNPLPGMKISKFRSSTYRVCGERKPKRHDTGPFATL